MEISVTFLLTGCLIQGVFCVFSISLPERVEALKGSCVFIPCTFDIDHVKDLTDITKRIWYKDGTPLTVVFDSDHPNAGSLKGEIFGTPTEKNCTTRFNNVRQSDNGSYFFRLESDTLQYSYRKPTFTQVEIAVIGSPPKPTVSLLKDQQEVTEMKKVTEVKEGSSVNLRCSTKIFCSSRPANLTWSSSPEHLLNESVTQQQRQEQTELISDLIFTVTHRHHLATFTCTVTHQLQQQITKNKSRTLHVQYAPKNTSAHVNASGFVLEGRSVTLSCSSDANPPVLNYTWYRDTEEPLKPVESGQNLTISNTNLTHSGRYVCTAQNEHGTQSASVMLDVQYAPKNTSVHVNASGFVLEGRSVTLSCSSDANPPVLIYTWYRDTEEPLKPVQSGQNLTISNTDPTHSGRYVCTAQNEHGTQSASVMLDVQYAPKNTSVHVNASGFVLEGRSVTLSCSSDANPPVLIYTWYRDTEEPLKPVESGQNLTISNTNLTHSGRYVCTAQNEHGTQNASVMLDVQFAPKISSSCNKSSVITCVCEAHGNPSPKLEWRLYGNALVNFTNTFIENGTLGSTSLKSVLIIHQHLTDTDVLQCFSANTLGTASASQRFHPIARTSGTETRFHHPSVLLGAAVGASAMMILCIIAIYNERRRNPKPSGTRQDDTSGLILSQTAMVSSGDEEHDYGNKDMLSAVTPTTPESLHYSSVDFTNAEPASGEIWGASSLTEEYAVVRHHSAGDAAPATDLKKDQSPQDSSEKITDVSSEDTIYENMTRSLVV
ncbi:B-cell receptor CD22-like [Rhinichthys klamathensis goyatoka]|uniref:B-cell receptor CD22-like n=1 Tax=Rhinichthys klamathensis goyatoka TaxID=3034132 RepID=UPI0024B59B8F|nr:B-cell receptor CD22-like [Rhinichthys klamathensis goyatoka]